MSNASVARSEWENYPENLDNRSFNLYEFNLPLYNSQLKEDSKRLCISDTEDIALKTISIGSKGAEAIIDTRSALNVYLGTENVPDTIRLILIPQQGSWGSLVIDEKCLRKLLTRFSVFPRFIDILRSFGQQTGFEDESSGGIYARRDDQDNIKELCYLIKHVEKHGHPERSDPWSVRQTGVYYQNSGTSDHTFILVNASQSLRRRLRAFQKQNNHVSPLSLHLLILSCSMENWRWYISDLEKSYLSMRSKAQLAKINERGEYTLRASGVRIEDTQEIHVLQEKCQQLAHVLDLDSTVIFGVGQYFDLSTSTDDQGVAVEIRTLSSFATEASMHVERLDRMLKRIEGTIALTRTILDFCGLASLQRNSRMMTALTSLAQEDNNRMADLTEQAGRDTQATKRLTFLALIFLPASFASSLMGMGYIDVHPHRHGFSLQFHGEFWVFLILTFLLLVFTMALHFWYVRNHRRVEKDISKERDFERIDS